MNRERTRQLLPVMQAFADGDQVQFENVSKDWVDDPDPSFASTAHWRIKPKEPREFWLNMDDINGSRPEIIQSTDNFVPGAGYIKVRIEVIE